MISRIVLENWRSHKSSELRFEKGTNVIVGVMGAGKSSIMDALCFALFGTFPSLNSKKVSIVEIVMSKPNKMQSAKVRLEFSHSGKEYAVERTVSAESKANQAKLFEGSRLIAGPKPTEVNAEIEKILDLDFELFSRAIYSEQNQIDSFLRLAPSERKKKFDELLDLEKYERVRANAQQLLNSFRKGSERDSARLEEMKKRFQEQGIEAIEEKTALKERRLLKLRQDSESLKKKLAELDSEFERLSFLKKRHDLLQESILKDSGKLEESKSSFESLSRELDGIELSSEKLKLRKKASEERLKMLKGARNAASLLGNDISALKASKHFLEQEISAKSSIEPRSLDEVKKEIEKSAGLALALEKKKAEIEEQLSSVKVQKGKLEGALFDQKNFIQELESLGAGSACPTCRRKLDEEHKSQLIHEAAAKISSLEKEFSSNNSNALNIEALKRQSLADSEVLASAKNSLENSIKILNEIGANSEKLKAVELQLSERQNALDARKQEFSETEETLLEGEQRLLEKALQACERKSSMDALLKKLEGSKKELSGIPYSPEEFDRLSLSISEKKSEQKSFEFEASSTVEVLDSLRQQIEALKALGSQISSLGKEIEGSAFFSEKLSIFSTTLESAQAEMRNHLVENVNSAMQDIWPRVYPYRDFQSARILVSGGNYELAVQSRSGEWTRVEGLLSGGERMAAAITIRVAFSLVLAQHLSWLILDEPTHNLDSQAVKVLSEMLKEHLPSLVEQVFVITHDRLLESAASSAVFEMQRDKDSDGATKVVQKSIAV